MSNIEKILEKLAEGNQAMDAIHTYDPLPLTFGSINQQSELLDTLGKWRSYENGDIPGMVYDNMLSYYNEGRAGRTIQGIELEDRTPVGIVSHPAPLDITSWAYAFPLVVQAGELTYQAFKPAKVDDNFIRSISIADTMSEVEKIENTPSGKNFEIGYYDSNDNLIARMEASQPVPISEWPGFIPLKDGNGTRYGGAMIREVERDFDPTIRREEDD